MTEEEGRKERGREDGGGRRKAVCFFGLEREVDVEEEEGKAKEGRRREEEGLSESRIGVKCIKCQVQNPWWCLLVFSLQFSIADDLSLFYFLFL